MPGVVIDRIWTGTLTPLAATVGGVEYPITLTVAQFAAPLDIVCATIQDALETATGEGWSFLIEQSNTDGPTAMAMCLFPWGIDFVPGFAGFLGYESNTISAAGLTPVYGDGVPGCRSVGALVGYGLPSLVIEREVVHDRTPVVWGSHPEWTIDLIDVVAAPVTVDVRRVPFAMFQQSQTASTYTGSAWSLTNRPGWLALRPIDTTANRQRLGTNGGRHTKETIRCAWIGGSI